MELSNAQKQAAIRQIVSREMAVDANPALESMKDTACVGLRGENGMSALSAAETHTRGGLKTRIAQETVITEFKV